ncbi:unnamed protein product [Symbiodinium natans]|uniref:Uncharacterized protein n=1 Tax=Symbiodinium natans TaxID=878477 RepID=A0A812UJK8_9DINO|nr:unnamed protein product [Symbiodinium natans]
MYICTFIAALMWVWYLWRSTTREGEVPLGLLVSIWFTTGTLSVGMCSLCNWAMVQLWAWLDPLCYITYPADNWPWEYTSTRCIMTNAVQWVLTAGIIEESFKFASLLRLRPSPSKVLQGVAGCRCRLPGLPKAWYMRLADSPLAVALCGVAAGGGLATTENFMYIFSTESIDKAFREGDLESAYGRIAASFAHMVWTGYAACGLAKWQFLPEGDPARPRSRVQFLLPPIFLHGLYNWCSTLQRCEAYEETYQGQLYKSDGCYLPPTWRMVFKAAHTVRSQANTNLPFSSHCMCNNDTCCGLPVVRGGCGGGGCGGGGGGGGCGCAVVVRLCLWLWWWLRWWLWWWLWRRLWRWRGGLSHLHAVPLKDVSDRI